MTSDSTDPRRVVSIPNSKSGLARACRTNHMQQLWYPWRQELRNAGARRSNGALLRRKHRSILYRNSATPATTASACARTQVRGSARFRACAQPSGALTTVPHITAAKTAGTGCSFGRCQGSCDTCCRGTIGPPKSSPAAHHAAWVCTKPRARVGRHTRGPTYPDIDIGASQTDSALMRGTARCLRRRPPRPAAQPRRCGCVRLGCHMQKFQDPRVA